MSVGISDETGAVGASDPPDAELIAAVRAGDDAAYGRLWARHHRAARAAAVAVTATFDPDDLVQEAFASILSALRRGKGPQGAFRPYLLASVRNIAASWGRGHREDPHDAFDEEPDPRESDGEDDRELDRGFTGAAFASLPARWQEVLWYGEVEQRKNTEVARILGMTPNATAQLASRAREGLRQAWVQAHLRGLADHSECRATVAALGAYTRGRGSRPERKRIEVHLAGCARCVIVAEEARDVSGRLRAVLLPLVLGAAGAASYGAWSHGGGAASAAEAAAAGLPVSADPASGGAASAGGASASGSSAGGAAAATMAGTASAGVWVGVAAAVGIVAIAVAAAAVSLAPADADSAPPADALSVSTEETDAESGTVPVPVPAPVAPSAPVAPPELAAEPAVDPPPAASPSAPPTAPVAPTVSLPPAPPTSPSPAPSSAPPGRPSPQPVPAPSESAPEPTPAPTEPAPEPVPLLPEGIPTIGVGTARWTDGGLVVDLGLEGAPDAEVSVRIGDRDPVRTILDAEGHGRLDVPVRARDLLENTVVRFAYVAGIGESTTEGPLGEMRLWALLRQAPADITNG